jgi:hypothetical protein
LPSAIAAGPTSRLIFAVDLIQTVLLNQRLNFFLRADIDKALAILARADRQRRDR